MATIEERLKRMRKGKTPVRQDTASVTSGRQTAQTGQSAAPASTQDESGNGTVTERLKRLRQAGQIQGFNSWLTDISTMSRRISEDYADREGQYQDAARFSQYRDDMDTGIKLLQSQANTYRNYFDTSGRDIYGDETVKQILSALDEGSSYLQNISANLGSEYDYWAQFEDEDAYNSYLHQQKEYERLSGLDVEGGKKTLENLQAQLEQAKQAERDAIAAANKQGFDVTGIAVDMNPEYENAVNTSHEAQAAREGIEKQITDLQRELQQAESIQTANRYNDYMNEGDFAQYSAQGAAIENPSVKDANRSLTNWFPAEVGNIVTYSRDNWESIAEAENDPEGGYAGHAVGDYRYHYMTDDEVSIYNYLLAKNGQEKAQEYLNSLEETLNYRIGTEQAGKVRGIDNTAARTLATGFYGVGAGLDQWMSGTKQLFSEERLPTTANQYGSAYIREDLADTGPEILGSSLGQAAYDAVTTTANMAPSILLSSLTAGLGAPAAVAEGLGAVTLGASAGGNAFNQALQEGYTQNEARNYAALIGASEAGLQYLLGGISSLGGKLTGKTAQTAVQNIDNALLRISADIGINMFGEGAEEYLQDILEPAFRNLVFDENNEIKLVSEDAAYSFLLGALTAGLMEGGHITASDIDLGKTGAAIKSAGQYETLLENALNLEPSSEAYQMASKMRSGSLHANNVNIGQLFASYAEAGGSLDFVTSPDVGTEPQTSVSSAADDLLTQAAEQVAQGGTVTNSMAERILADQSAVDALAEAAGVTIDHTMTKAQQRAAVKNAVSELAGRKAGFSEVASGTAPTSTKTAQESAQTRPVAQQAYDVKRIQQAASSLGENGAKALSASYDGSISADAFYGGFAAYYEAGVSGLDMGKVRSEYGAQLNEAQKFAAYSAGQNDAAASLAAEREGVQTATVYGDEAGFIQSEYSASLPKATVSYYNDLARAVGVKIQMAPATGEGGANGWYKDGIIYIAADAENAGEVVAKHEITHRMQELAPEQYRKYRDYAVNALAERFGSSSALVEHYKARYAENETNLTTEQAMDEIAADFTENLLLDPKKFESLARQDRSVARKLLDAIKDFISKVKSVFKGDKTAQDQAAVNAYGMDMATLEEAARLWEEAYQASAGQAKTAQKSTALEGGTGRLSVKGNPYTGKDLSADSTIYTYDFLTSLPDMKVTRLPEVEVVQDSSGKVDKSGVVTRGMRNAHNAGAERDGKVFVRNSYTGKQLMVTTNSIRHGLNGGLNRLLTNARLGAVIGDVVKNAVPINALHNTAQDVTGTYAMAAYATDSRGREFVAIITVEQKTGRVSAIEAYDMLHAVSGRQKKSSQADTKSQSIHSIKAATISIADLLEAVKSTHQSILSEDVLEHLGETRDPAGDYAGKVKFSLKTDSQGQKLTAEQAEFFKDSKVRDEDGNLKVVYHGSPADFNTFSLEFMGTNGTAEGYGFYFTDKRSIAEGYSQGLEGQRSQEKAGRLFEVYLDIKKPLSDTEVTISRSEFKKFLREMNKQVDEDGEPLEFLSNYGDVAWEGLNSVLNSAMASEYDGSDNDVNMISSIINGCGNMELVYEVLRKTTGYDGIIVENTTWGGDQTIYIAFHPEQIKSVTNQNPTSNPDIRYSLKGSGSIQREMAALQAENDLLRERVEYWKGQTKRTQRVTTDKKSVTKAARNLIRSYGADLETADINADLQSLYDYIASGYDGKDELTWEEAYRRAKVIAEKLVENAVAVDDTQYREYSELRSYFRNTKLTISEEDSHNIPDYNDFRKRNMGRLNLGKGETNIDRVYEELSEVWPEFFDSKRETHPADQLMHIADVLDGIYDITGYNPFSLYMEQATADAANEIMEMFFDLPQTRATFADRQAQKLDAAKAKGRQKVQEVREQSKQAVSNARLAGQMAQGRQDAAALRKANERTETARQKGDERLQKVREQSNARLEELRRQNRQKVQQTIEKERQRRDSQIEKLKTKYREKDAAGRERRSARELRAKIIRHTNELSRKLLRPSDKQHIPENLRTAVASMLEAINLESGYTLDPETIHEVQRKDGKSGGMTGKRLKDGSGTPTQRTEAFRKLRLAYAEITREGGDYTLIIDPDLMDNLNELETMKDTPLAEMGTAQLATVWATIKGVETSIRTANKMLSASRFENISQFAEGIKDDNLLRRDRGDYKGIVGKVDKLVNLDMLTPQGYFHRLGKTGEELFHLMRSAQDRHITIMRQAQEATGKIVGKTDVNKLEREIHTFDIDGEKLTMSTAQIMSLYELMKRQQAQDHILKGGIRPDAINSGRGLRMDRRAAPVHVTIEDLAAITDVLTDEQVKMADGLQRYMGGELAELGNEASMAVYGYRKFGEENYFPIKVDKNQTKRDVSKEAQAATIAGRGFTKSVTPKANNAVMVESIFDTYSSHVNDMATYAAWLPTMEDVRRIRDFTFRDGEGNRTGDVKTIIERVFGKNGNAYLNKLMDDINQGVRTKGTGNLTDGLVGNYKAAAVAANIRVILQQPTAILRAMDTLDPKYLLAGTVKRGDWEKVKKYAPIAVWKDWGYFDINTGRQMKDVLLESDSKLDKVKQAAMAGAGKADSFAWARLWNAVEAETKDKRPGLKSGTEEFYHAVAARFNEIIDGTQVVDGLLQRSQIMRSPDALTKMSTSFMGEPTKTYNMFVNAVYDLRHATGKEARAKAKRGLARTTAALVTSFAVNAVMQSIVDALRDDDKERDYWEKLLTAYTGFTGDEETFLDYWNSFWNGNFQSNFNPLGYLPYFKDFVSIVQGYDVSRMDMEPISKVWDAAVNMKKAITGEGKYSLAGASANLVAEAARLLGIPVANLKRDIQAGVTTAAIETDSYLMQYRIDKALLNMGYSGNTSNFMDILYNASINDPEAYEIIYADMVDSGIGEDKIRNAMETRMKRDQGVESVEELESRYLTPAQEKTYDSIKKRVSGTSVWRAANETQRSSLEGDLYNLTVGNSDGIKLQEKIDGGAAYGIDETDYLLYRLSLHVVDQPSESGKLGSYTGEEVQAAIDMLTGLSDNAKSYLWEAQGKSEKSNPYK